MSLKLLLAAAALALTAASAQASIVVNGTDDVYGLGAGGDTAPEAINVSGVTSITFSVSSGNTVTLNSGGNDNDADGVGAAVSSSTNSGANGIAGLTAPNAGYLTGAFVGATLGATPAGLDFVTSGTAFTSLSPLLQQAFFIGDGLTGDGAGATQTFYVPAGATTLYLGISDACGYNGGPSCYGDNSGSFTVTATATTATAGGVPEPGVWAMMLLGLGGVGVAIRSRRRSAAVAA